MGFFSKKEKEEKEDEAIRLIDSQLYIPPQDIKTVGFIYSVATTQFSVALLKIRMEKMDSKTLLRANKTIRCLQLGLAYDS